MPDIHCQSFTLPKTALANVEAELAGLNEYFCDDPNGTLVSNFEELTDLFRLSQQTGLTVRFHDEGFDPLVVLWRWLGEGVGVAYMLLYGQPRQINLMLAGVNRTTEATVIRRFGRLLVPEDGDWEAIFEVCRPTLATFTSIPPHEESGAYLLGLILYAAFSELTGLS